MIDTHYLKDETLWMIPYEIKNYVLDDVDCADALKIILGELDEHPDIPHIQLLLGDDERGFMYASLTQEEATQLASYLLMRVRLQKENGACR